MASKKGCTFANTSILVERVILRVEPGKLKCLKLATQNYEKT